MSADPLILAPYGVDPLPLLARRLLDRHAHELPDLSHHIALFPQPESAARFRAALLGAARARGVQALVPPWIGTLSTWVTTRVPAMAPLNPAARELLLLDALAPFSALSERFGPWSLIDGLLPVLDELADHAVTLPSDRSGVSRVLADGYGVAASFGPLNREADWIHTLWQAWNGHLQSHAWQEPATARRAAMTQALAALPRDTQIYLAADFEIRPSERMQLRELLERGQLTLLLQGRCTVSADDYHPDRPIAQLLHDFGRAAPAPAAPSDPYGVFLDEAYRNDGAALSERAAQRVERQPHSPARDRLALYVASDLEDEARAVELQVRRWLIAGLRDVAIVTSDRKLARRIRALLERANVMLHDSTGWALSTTSAATAIARWLECCERGFAYAPLLDFLKSPFVTLGMTVDGYARTVRRLEHDLIRRYNLSGGLARYRAAWRRYGNAETDDGAIEQLLQRLADAAAPLERFMNPAQSFAPAAYLDGMMESLKRLDLIQRLSADPAGRELLTTIETLRSVPTAHTTRLHYASFRRWLERELERRRFRPAALDARVRLLSLPESRYCHFEAVVIAGCTADYMPGPAAPSPFFNEAVRRQLRLPGLGDRLSQGLHDFRRLLQAANQVVLSYRRLENREPRLPSPWVERLVAFHEAAYGPLPDNELSRLARLAVTRLGQREEPLPSPGPMPAARVTRAPLPMSWSASTHQRLLDCPYQFYAADVLGLAPIEEIPEEIERSHYGERVHRILQAFHRGIPGLPGPWRGPLAGENRERAEQLLHDIARAVFAGEIEERFTTRAWLYHWQELIPAYLNWLQDHWAMGTQVEATEVKAERTIYVDGSPLVLKGRIDRLDKGPDGTIVLDYKTGRLPDLDAILSGEQAQLPFYTLLVESPVSTATYVGLRAPPVKTGCELGGDSLSTTRSRLLDRIGTIAAALKQGAGLPAWGDAQICGRCHYEGICRKELWTMSPTENGNGK